MQSICGAPEWSATRRDASPLMRSAAEVLTPSSSSGGEPGSDLLARVGGLPGLQQAYGGSLSGLPSFRVLAQCLQQQQQRHVVWRTSRLRLLAEGNYRRCVGGVLGQHARMAGRIRATIQVCLVAGVVERGPSRLC